MDNIKTMKINDVEVTPVSATTFSTTGENTYYVELNEPMTTSNGMFVNCERLTSLDLSKWDTSNVTNMSRMFSYCYNLSSIDGISNWDTSKVTAMQEMFYNCYNLTSPDLSKWDTSNVANMYFMFYGCRSLTSLDSISNWDTSNVTNMSLMFGYCSSLTSLDLSKWDISNVSSMGGMFKGCNNLTEVRMGGNPSKVMDVYEMFDGVTTNGTFYYNPMYDYSKIIAKLPSTWTAVPCTLVDGVLVPNE